MVDASVPDIALEPEHTVRIMLHLFIYPYSSERGTILRLAIPRP